MRLVNLTKRIVRALQRDLLDDWLLPKPALRLPGTRGVVTTFKDNLEFQPTFVEYYQKVWKPDWIVSLIGCTDVPTGGVPFGLRGGRVFDRGAGLYDVYYQTPPNTSGFLAIRERLFARVRAHRPDARILVADCDEFVFGNIDQLWQSDSFVSHFFEHIPSKPFSPHEPAFWSAQPWFYRFQSNGAPTSTVSHWHCKRFDLAHGRLGRHAGEHCSFEHPAQANGQSYTFHAGVTSLAHYLGNKHFDQTLTIGYTDEVSTDAAELELKRQRFEKFYAQCHFPKFEFRLWDLVDRQTEPKP
jgi:hypothetical protein